MIDPRAPSGGDSDSVLKKDPGPMPGEAALAVNALKKTYGDFAVSLDLTVGRGETLALVGPSGSGKTTALNLIAGLAAPESGKAFIDGEDITGLPPWKRNISVVFQDLALFPHLDVGGNIAYGLFIKKVPPKERRRIIEETLELVRLPGYASRRVHTLSGGERQRVAIARALAANPRVLLLDEPFSSLDAPLRKSLRREFLEIRSHSKAPCVFITHDREEAVMLGDRIALMEAGRIVETGTGRKLLFAPETENAARFFGAGQTLPCRILGKSEAGVETSSPLGILTIPPGSECSPGSPALFIPHDAVFCAPPFQSSAPAQAGVKACRARAAGALFEGQSLILKLLLNPWGESPGVPGEPLPFEAHTDPRTAPPAEGAEIGFWVDQRSLRFVTRNAGG